MSAVRKPKRRSLAQLYEKALDRGYIIEAEGDVIRLLPPGTASANSEERAVEAAIRELQGDAER